jgi:tetratricopeptide (TPR) repeat protein
VAFVLPVSGLFQAGGQAVADRFAYLPILMPLFLAGGGLVMLRRQLAPNRQGILAVLVGAHVLWLVARTQQQIPVWRDQARMWMEVCAQVRASTTEYGYAAAALARQHRYDEALLYAEQAYRILPDAADSRRQIGTIFRDLADRFAQIRRFPECMFAGLRAAELLPEDPVGHAAHGLGLLKLGRAVEAIPPLERAVALREDLPGVRYNLACAYVAVGRLPEALKALAVAVEKLPSLAEAAQRDPLLAGLREDAASREEFARIVGAP